MVRTAALSGLMVAATAGLARAVPAPETPVGGMAAPAAAEPAAAPAKEAPQGGLMDPDLGTAFFTVLIFVALLIILKFTAWKPILAGLKGREQAIRDSIEAAARAKSEAERSTRELQAKMEEAQRQSAAQLTQAKADAVKIADGIRAQAETDAAALKDRTVREIDAAKQQALTEINEHAAVLGTSVARKILQRQVNAEDQQRLVDESLAEMARKN